MEDSTRSSVDLKRSEAEFPIDLESGSPAPTIVERPQGRLRRHFGSTINDQYTDNILLLCWFSTGILDSTMFNAYRTFVSMQTGNTMFLGLGASDYDITTRPYGWAKSLTSLICFVLGAIFFSRLAHYLRP
ncbi:MAG: hypothetical protein Q9208_002870 [Pyrenodesmia sp. 3 TL-2023]